MRAHNGKNAPGQSKFIPHRLVGCHADYIHRRAETGSPIADLFLHPEKYTEPVDGGESFEQLFARTGEFLREVAYPLVNAGKDVLIVGHGAMDSSIVCQVRNIPIADFWSAGIVNCKLMKLM